MSATRVKTVGYQNSLIIPRPVLLASVVAHNNSGSGQYIMLFDSATLPANGANPDDMMYVPPLTTMSFDYTGRFYDLSNGCVVCNSSTGDVLTIGSANCSFFVQVITS